MILHDESFKVIHVKALQFLPNYSVDATEPSENFGRLINHSRHASNVKPVLEDRNGKKIVVFYATKLIQNGKEVLYDYADRNRESFKAFPWLKD